MSATGKTTTHAKRRESDPCRPRVNHVHTMGRRTARALRLPLVPSIVPPEGGNRVACHSEKVERTEKAANRGCQNGRLVVTNGTLLLVTKKSKSGYRQVLGLRTHRKAVLRERRARVRCCLIGQQRGCAFTTYYHVPESEQSQSQLEKGHYADNATFEPESRHFSQV
jgi:hypothetical protein